MMFTNTTAWAAGEQGTLHIYKNGVIYSILGRKDNYTSTNSFMQLNGSDLVPLIPGDTINIRVSQASGGALALYNDQTYNYVAIEKIG